MQQKPISKNWGFGLVAVFISLSAACSNPGKPGDDPATAAPPSTPNNSDVVARPVAPTPAESNGQQIVVNFKSLAGLKNISGYVVGEVDQHGFKATDSNGRFAFFTMKPGRYDIVLEAQKAADDSNQNTVSTLGMRINGILIKSGESTVIREPVDLLPTFAIKGKIHLLNGVAHGAINVSIPGTRIKTTTEADGSFTLTGVPSGSHSVVATNSGFLDAVYDSRIWSAQDAPELAALTMLPDTQALATGIHYKGAGIVPNEENVTTVFLVRPNGMNKYRVSETADFAGAVWLDFQSSIDVKFPVGGERRLFVQYAKDLQQFSAIFNVDIPVATTP